MIFEILTLTLFLLSLIFVHELGHFFFARLNGVDVEEFAIGLGPLLFSRYYKGTLFAFRLFPIGGRCKLYGEDLKSLGKIPNNLKDRSFHHLTPGKKIAIALGGPLFNFIFALAIFAALQIDNGEYLSIKLRRMPVVTNTNGERFIVSPHPRKTLAKFSLDDKVFTPTPFLFLHSVDEPKSVIQISAKNLTDLIKQSYYPLDLQIESVLKNSMAFISGLKANDIIKSIDGINFTSFENAAEYINEKKGLLLFKVWRNGHLHQKYVDSDNGKIGVISSGQYMRPDGQLSQGRKLKPKKQMTHPFFQIMNDYWQLFNGEIPLSEISGPVTIAKLAGQSINYGPGLFLMLLAVISLNLAIINLFPIPVLDGGHIFLNLMTLITGRSVPVSVLRLLNKAGLAGISLLIGLALFNDITVL